jgi:hypothetical protein
MSVSTAIGLVSTSLYNLLIGEMKLTPEVDVTILAPDESSKERRLNLFLYKVQENPILKNMDWQVKRGSPTQLVPPPLSLNLFYVMTPYALNHDFLGNTAIHEILGEAMRVFYENPVVPEAYLAGDLQDAREQIKIMLNPLDLEELSRMWSTFGLPFRLSVPYEVSVVQLDMLPESERVMSPRVRAFGAPEVGGQYAPPVVTKIDPASGAAGTSVTVHGEHLTGWQAYVTVMGRRVLQEQDLTGDTFDVALPADLPPGFHEIRIDVSHLSRRTFFFEVTV